MAHYSTQLSIAVVALALATMFAMFRLWNFPFDNATQASTAPRWMMALYRTLGIVFIVLFAVWMYTLAPSIWRYQSEFPARITAQIVVGIAVAFVIIVVVAISAAFEHFESWLPYLVTSAVLGTLVLFGLSIPFSRSQRAFDGVGLVGDEFSMGNQERVKILLPTSGVPAQKEADADDDLSSLDLIADGREVMLDKCMKCHELKTILEKPRSPQAWWRVVTRMSQKPALFTPMTAFDERAVMAYLIAITPSLQRSVADKRRAMVARDEIAAEVDGTAAATTSATQATNPVLDHAVFDRVCSQCHDTSEVDAHPPKSQHDADRLIHRMISEDDAEIGSTEVPMISFWLNWNYVEKHDH